MRFFIVIHKKIFTKPVQTMRFLFPYSPFPLPVPSHCEATIDLTPESLP